MSDLQVHAGAYTLSCNNIRIQKEIESIRVIQEICVPTMFEVTIPIESIEDPWWAVTLNELKPGDEIKIGIGRGRAKPLVTGHITMIWPELNSELGGQSKVTIAGFDSMVRLRFGARTRTFVNQTDHSIVAEVAHDAGLAVRTSGSPGDPYPYVLQNNESDYDFLCRRCAQLNYELMVEGKALVFRPSQQGLGPTKTLLYHRDFESASLKLSVPRRGSTVAAFGYDVSTGEAVLANANSPTSREKMGGEKAGYDISSNFPQSAITFERPDLISSRAIERFVDSQYPRGISTFIEGAVKVSPGDATLVAGVSVKLTGLGGRFDGPYYIYKSTHTYNDGSYDTEVEVGRSGI
jgi:phage protein D